MKNYFITLILMVTFCFSVTGQEPFEEAEKVFIDINQFRQKVARASKMAPSIDKRSGLIVDLPYPGGATQQVFIFENNLMSDEFQSAFPLIKTYSVFLPENNKGYGSLTVSPFGIYGFINSSEGAIEISPVDMTKSGMHAVGYQVSSDWTCGVDEALSQNDRRLVDANVFSGSACFSNGDQTRTYRLAIAVTGEFYQTVAGGITDVSQADIAVNARITAIVNGVRTIFFNELAVNFTLLTPRLYRDPATDDFDPASSDSRTEQAQSVISNNFNDGDYDIGHVLNYSDFCGSPIRGLISGDEMRFPGVVSSHDGSCVQMPIPPMSSLRYKNITFNVSVSGTYTFMRTASTNLNEGIALYSIFDPGEVCQSFLGASRELDVMGNLTPTRSPIVANLVAGSNVRYRLVVFSTVLDGNPGSTGIYEIDVNGPGDLIGNCQYADGGLASPGVCDDATKARGWSSIQINNIIWDFYQVVAHEFGHQFNAGHTFNGTGRGCTEQIVATSAYEIGSGTTLMSYRGVCNDDQNVAASGTGSRLNDYFHTHSLTEMIYFINSSATCAVIEPIGNNPPIVDANPTGGNYTIPRNTPFELEGEGEDIDGDEIFYAWEQYDEDGPGTPTQGFIGPTAGASPIAPLFRSFPPRNSPSRTFPTLNAILNNANVAVFQPLPAVTRTLTFRLTARDRNPGGGGVACDEIDISVDGTTGPFRVTDPNTDACLESGTMQTIMWDVAGSVGGNVNCANVDILLSVDGGVTFPYILANSTPNDGSHDIILPDMVRTLQGRIKIACSDNIFFDINDEDIVIECPELLIVTDNPASGIYRARETIETSGTVVVNENTEFLAGEQVILRSGFWVNIDPGQSFLARIQPCDPCSLVSQNSPIIGKTENVQKKYWKVPQISIPKNEPKIEGSNLIKIYPNPAFKDINLSYVLVDNSEVSLHIMNQYGQVIKILEDKTFQQKGDYNRQVQLDDLPAGVYYITLQTSTERLVKSFVVSRL